MKKRAISKLAVSVCFPGAHDDLNVLPKPVENIAKEKTSSKLFIPKENPKGFPSRNGVIRCP